MGYLSHVRNDYVNGQLSFEEVKRKYVSWVNRDEYLVFYSEIENKNGENLYYAIKCAKRGNDVYRNRIYKRFREFYDLRKIDNEIVFCDNHKISASNIFFLTLTYDTKLCSIDEAWEKIGKQFNEFLTNIKNNFGKCYIIRCFESFKNGYPHIHAILFFQDASFKIIKNVKVLRNKKKIRYLLETPIKEYFESKWHSFIKIEALKDLGGLFYLLKYITKVQFSQNNFSTNARLWLHGKRSYSMSMYFKDYFLNFIGLLPIRLDTNQHNSKESLNLFYVTTIQATKEGLNPFFKFFLNMDWHGENSFWWIFNERL
ncbi:MAG: hypothetical protein GF317_23565 [Candidatus Lokiarchaeota archaeon]|nr:hypothetical protein [Candidatus Lokiarchaeota archaeon]